VAGLVQRFRRVQDDPDMRRLHDILLAYRMEGFEERGTSDGFADASVDNSGNEEGST